MRRPSSPALHLSPFSGVFGRSLGIATAAAITVGMYGCANPPQTSVDSPAMGERAPVVEPGLEVVNWVTSADDLKVAATLASCDEIIPGLSSTSRELWQNNGLRLFSIPVDRLKDVEAALAGSGSVHRQWLGQALVWTSLVSGPSFAGDVTLATDQDALRLPPGAMRLLTRCWIEPSAPPLSGSPPSPDEATPARLRIELTPQFRERRHAEGDLLASASISPLNDGLVFSRLSITLAAPPGVALILVGENPAADWKRGPGESADQPAAASVGPRVLTVGEAMLVGDASALPAIEGPTPPARFRSIVLLLPRVPERFSLMSVR